MTKHLNIKTAITITAIATLIGGTVMFLSRRGEKISRPDVIVLITIDTLRADHLGCYGYPRNTSPFIDRLAKKGVLFRHAFSSCSHTTPAHASIFTSLQPSQHLALCNGNKLPPTVLTAAKIFKEAGYITAGFFSVNYLQELADDFDTSDWATDKSGRHFRTADHTVERTIKWLSDKKPSAKLFLWVHFFDVHAPLQPPPEFLKLMRPKSKDEKKEIIDHLTKVQHIPPDFYSDDESMLNKFNQYDAEIAFVDRELGRLFDYFEEKGLNKNSLWIITADHGEGLGNHHYPEHSKKIYNEQIRVPLIFFSTTNQIAPGTVGDLVRHIDILPTLTALINYPLRKESPQIQGTSLLPFLARGPRRDRERFSFSQRRPRPGHRGGWGPKKLYTLQDLHYKYIYHSDGKNEFYDLREDPFESRNLIGQPSKAKERIKNALRHYYDRLRPTVGFTTQTEINPKYIKTLKALGYL